MKNLFTPMKMFIGTMLCAAIMVVLFVIASSTSSAATVGKIADFLWVPGIIGSGLLGMWFALVMSKGITATQPQYVIRAGGPLIFGAGGLLLLWYAFTIGADDDVYYTVVGLAILAFIFAGLAWHYTGTGRTAPKILRYLIILAAFAAGVLPGMIFYFILSVIISDIYCQLTSSKCM